MVVAFAPGGVSDITARAIAQKMTELLGQQIVVDNRAGAGGTIGSGIVANAPPDGYTLAFSSLTTFAIGPNLRKSLPYDPVRDFAAIGGISQTPNILVLNTSLPFVSLKGLVSYAKANPGKLSFGSSGVGSVGHLSGEVLRTLTGVDMTHVPYKSAALAYPDVMSGSIAMVFDSLPSAIQHIRSGKVRPAAVLSDKRSPLLPDVPTFGEEGYPGATLRFWNGLHGPAGLPPAIVTKLNETLIKALAAPDLRQRFSDLGAVPFPTTPQELAELHRSDIAKIARTVKAAGIQSE
jgi:tripartite-type tricarboxylate transporter receptor subunit TctC